MSSYVTTLMRLDPSTASVGELGGGRRRQQPKPGGQCNVPALFLRRDPQGPQRPVPGRGPIPQRRVRECESAVQPGQALRLAAEIRMLGEQVADRLGDDLPLPGEEGTGVP